MKHLDPYNHPGEYWDEVRGEWVMPIGHDEESNLYVFVYGTLKRGCRLNYHLTVNGGTFVREDVTLPKYLLYDNGSYPCLRDVSDLKMHGERIAGEVWHINEKILRRLDQVESVPYMYNRVHIALQDTVEQVWGYVWNNKNLPFGTYWKPCGTKWTPRDIPFFRPVWSN